MLRQFAWMIVIAAAGTVAVAEDQSAERPSLAGPQVQQEATEGGKKDFAGKEQARRPVEQLQEILAKLNITDEQKTAIEKIVAERTAGMKEDREKLDAARQAVKAAKETGDQQAVTDARVKLRQLIREGPGPLTKEIEPLLSDEQKKQLREALPDQPGKPMGGGPGGPDGPGRDPLARLQHGLDQLDLSEEQKAQVKCIIDEHKQAMQKYRDEHAEEFEAIQEEMHAAREAGDHEAMQHHGQQIGQLMSNAPVNPLQLAEQIKGVLTPEQLQKFDEMRAQRGGPRGPGDEMGGPGSDGERGHMHRGDGPGDESEDEPSDDQLDL